MLPNEQTIFDKVEHVGEKTVTILIKFAGRVCKKIGSHAHERSKVFLVARGTERNQIDVEKVGWPREITLSLNKTKGAPQKIHIHTHAHSFAQSLERKKTLGPFHE